MMMEEKVLRLWYGGVRDAAYGGEKALPEGMNLSPLQKTKLQILLRQEQCDDLDTTIEKVENLYAKTAKRIWKDMYSELMEDAIAGIWNDEENLEIALFLSRCTEGIEYEEEFYELFDSILGEGDGRSRQEHDAVAEQVKDKADESIAHFIKERERKLYPKLSENEDLPPPWLDEFEYIDWVMTH